MSQTNKNQKNHPKSDYSEIIRLQNSVYQEEDNDACCGLCCFSCDDAESYICFLLGFICCPLWCLLYCKNRKSKKFSDKFFAYLSCIGCTTITLSIVFLILSGLFVTSFFFNTLENMNENEAFDFFSKVINFFSQFGNDNHDYGNVENYEL